MHNEPHPEQCNCITYLSKAYGKATCWACVHGQHLECTAHKHGNPRDFCPWLMARVVML